VQPPTTEERRWTIHVCRGCGTYASPDDLEPRFGNIVVHDRPADGCTEDAEVVEVVEASAFDALARELEEAREHVRRALHELEHVHPDNRRSTLGASSGEYLDVARGILRAAL
jgi:hypothetical protein